MLDSAPVRFYLDENIEIVIAEQLRQRGIEVFTVQELGTLGGSDLNHLHRATQLGCVLCTYDVDYLTLAAQGIEHAGIIRARFSRVRIGDWIERLELVHGVYTAEDMRNRVEYL